MVRKYCIVMSAFGCFSSFVIDLPKFSTVGNNQLEIKDRMKRGPRKAMALEAKG